MKASSGTEPADAWRSVPYRMSIGLNHQHRDDGSIPSENLTCFVFAFPDIDADIARLERALWWAVTVNPALGHHYRVDSRRGPQYREAADWRPAVEVVEPEESGWEQVRAEAQRVADAEMYSPFDLRDGRLLRVVCVRHPAEAGFALVIKVDHTVCDGLSYAQFLDDLAAAHRCDEEGDYFTGRRRASLARVAAAERRALAGGGTSELCEAWRRRLPEGIPELVLEQRTPWRECTTEGDQALILLEGEAYRRHVREAADLSVSSFMLATGKLLHAMRPSVLDGGLSFFSPFPGRFVPAARGVLGNFVSVLPVTVDALSSAGLRQTVAAVREGVLWTMQHQGIPFDAIQDAVRDAVRGTADTSGEFAYERRSIFISGNPVMRLELDGVAGVLSVPKLSDAMFDISLWISDTGRELRCSSVFRTALLSRSLVESWLAALGEPVPAEERRRPDR